MRQRYMNERRPAPVRSGDGLLGRSTRTCAAGSTSRRRCDAARSRTRWPQPMSHSHRADEGTRTPNHRFTRAVRCQLRHVGGGADRAAPREVSPTEQQAVGVTVGRNDDGPVGRDVVPGFTPIPCISTSSRSCGRTGPRSGSGPGRLDRHRVLRAGPLLPRHLTETGLPLDSGVPSARGGSTLDVRRSRRCAEHYPPPPPTGANHRRREPGPLATSPLPRPLSP